MRLLLLAFIFSLLFATFFAADAFVYEKKIDGSGDGPANKFKNITSISVFEDALYVSDPQTHFIKIIRGNTVERKITLPWCEICTIKQGLWVNGSALYFTAPETGNAFFYDGSRTEIAKESWHEYTRPVGIFVDGDDIYLTDAQQNRIFIYNRTSGSAIRSFGSNGNGYNQFSNPGAIFVSERIYVADTGNDRIQVFSKNLTYLNSISRIATTAPPWNVAITLNNPEGIFVADRIYVADTGNAQVVVFNLDGYPIATLGGKNETREDYILQEPRDVFVSEGKLYVANGDGNVLVYKIDPNGLNDPTILSRIAAVNATITEFNLLSYESKDIGVNETTIAGQMIADAEEAYSSNQYNNAIESLDEANKTILSDTAQLRSNINETVSSMIYSYRVKLAALDYGTLNMTLRVLRIEAEDNLNQSEKLLKESKNYSGAIQLVVSGKEKTDAILAALESAQQPQQPPQPPPTNPPEQNISKNKTEQPAPRPNETTTNQNTGATNPGQDNNLFFFGMIAALSFVVVLLVIVVAFLVLKQKKGR